MKKFEMEEKVMQVYNYTIDYVKENGFPPSVRDICADLRIKSTATAYSYVNKLKEKGLIDKFPLKKRAITLSQQNNYEFKNIPLLGTIHAGQPIFAVENLEGYYPLPPDFNDSNADFALKVSGNSMINAGIYDRDTILIKSQPYAENGEIVVALIDDSATVKRFYKKNNKIILHPENDEMQDLVYDDVTILGVVTGLFRKL